MHRHADENNILVDEFCYEGGHPGLWIILLFNTIGRSKRNSQKKVRDLMQPK